jgi:hypothetical protein
VTPENVAEILLVEAAEEARPEAVPDEARIDALEAAGDLDDERRWFARRAAYLLDGPLRAYRPLLRVHDAFAPGAVLNLALPFLLGLSSNALGPREQIHVLYNPIVLLVAWNLVTYGSLALLSLRSRGDEGAAQPLGLSRIPRRELGAPGAGGFIARLARRSAARLWLRAVRSSAGAREEAKALAQLGARFLELWESAARPWFALRTRQILHLAAFGITLGAIAGMYVRGLFFEYEMVWRSTFVREPESVARVLATLLAPACAALGRARPDAADAAALLSAEGVGAAPWIHLLAVSALLFVVLPRALLAARAGQRARRSVPALELGLARPYFAAILAQAREIQVGRVKREIESAVREECERFADGIARFVAESLYERSVVPELERFRSEGGSVKELETRIREACAAFEPALATHLKSAERAFEEDLARDVLERVRPDLILPPSGAGRLGRAVDAISAQSVGHVGGAISGKLTRDVGAAVTLAVAAVAGSLSGGFGAHLGTAILVGLLHTSGPVGFGIGALAGALAAAAALVAGRKRVDETLRGISLPAVAVRLVLRRARFERLVAQGRERCEASVRELVGAKLAPLSDELADQVWARVKPLLARGAAPEQPA